MITTNRLHKSRSIGTKLSPEQHASVESRARKQDLGVSEYVRQTLIAALHQPSTNAVMLVLLQETMALRTILLNLLFSLANDEKISADMMQAWIMRADAEKVAKASNLLIAAPVEKEDSTAQEQEAA
jgi:hypothetical protein